MTSGARSDWLLPPLLIYSSPQAQCWCLQHDLGHASIFAKSRWNHVAQQFVMGQLKVSVELVGHLCWVCPSVWVPEIPSPHRAFLPTGGISATSSTMPNPISFTRTQM